MMRVDKKLHAREVYIKNGNTYVTRGQFVLLHDAIKSWFHHFHHPRFIIAKATKQDGNWYVLEKQARVTTL